MKRNHKILAISGSLRARSSNTLLIRAAVQCAPSGMEVSIYEGLGTLPHFNPDLDGENPPSEVTSFRAQVASSDGLLISSPEYAHGVPGALKNALDWLVSTVEFPGKPVLLIGGGEYVQAQLAETLRTMSAKVQVSELIRAPVLRAAFDDEGRFKDLEIQEILRSSLQQWESGLN